MERNGKAASARVVIPDGVTFADLALARDSATGDVTFDCAVIERICSASGIDPAAFLGAPEDNLAALLTAWYSEHRARGGAPDSVADDLINEALAEDALGGGFSHSPGRA